MMNKLSGISDACAVDSAQPPPTPVLPPLAVGFEPELNKLPPAPAIVLPLVVMLLPLLLVPAVGKPLLSPTLPSPQAAIWSVAAAAPATRSRAILFIGHLRKTG